MRYLKGKKLLIIIICYIFLTINFIIKYTEIYTNFINPLFWCCILIYLVIDCQRKHVRLNKNKKYLKYMIIISCVHTVIYFYLGVLLGFSKNIYDYKFISTIIPIIGIEVTRSVIATRNKNNRLVLTFITILFVLVEIKYNQLVGLYINREAFFQFICESIIPLIAYNILCTYLTLQSSFLLPLTYRISNKLIILISPILVNVDWFVIATTGVLSPILVYYLFKYRFTKEKYNINKKSQSKYLKIINIVTIIVSINIICFMLGVFKYKPITILSNSMAPDIERGDVVIFKKLDEGVLEDIPLNTVIIYKIGNQNIAHRIVDKVEKEDKIFYKTKGDQNNLIDGNLVGIEQISGMYVFHVKYIGFPSIWLYEYFNNKDAKVEIK